MKKVQSPQLKTASHHVQGKIQPSSQATPMIAQYIEIKNANPDCLLFYRMGDFFELFFDDAVIASQVLGITLTKRGKHLDKDIPMAGVPVHAANDYLHKLIEHGFRVAVCEQVEDPAEAKKRGSGAVVRREVQRLVTAGTITEDSLLEAKRYNYLMAITQDLASENGSPMLALSWIDITSGEFQCETIEATDLASELARIEPREIILPESLFDDPKIANFRLESGIAFVSLANALFNSTSAQRELKEYFGVETAAAFGDFTRAELSAIGAILHYVERTQRGEKPPIQPPAKLEQTEFLQIDAATRGNLELVKTLSGDRKGSLLHCIDMTATASGARLLGEWLATPLTDMGAINARLDAVAFFHTDAEMRDAVLEALKRSPDLARALTRISLGRSSPRDLAAVGIAISQGRNLADLFENKKDAPKAILEIVSHLVLLPPELARKIEDALNDDLPATRRDGGFIRKGYNLSLDELRELRENSRKVIVTLEKRYAEETQVKNLRIKHNNVLGYFIEVSEKNADALLSSHEKFVHRQTLASAMRFTTVELGELENRIVTAQEKSLALEQTLFDELSQIILQHEKHLYRAASALARLDTFLGLAQVALRHRLTRPKLDRSLCFDVKKGRHLVVEAAMEAQNRAHFVSNDCYLEEGIGKEASGASGSIWLITGPNMAGKSTFLRQNALIAIMAQMGSFVPAEFAHIGVFDRIFSRVGASDDLARGRSTFMVEMVETAVILNQATERSLVILDEIGRGTATFDGLSIAWATMEHLHEMNRCRALFATHFHELTILTKRLKRLSNHTISVKDWQGEIVFLHEVKAGSADRSYGVHVAKLAGLPPIVIKRAREVLDQLEQNERTQAIQKIDELPLFSVSSVQKPTQKTSEAMTRLKDLHPDQLTPKQALDELYELKKLLKTDHVD